jgi:hypothetical protein
MAEPYVDDGEIVERLVAGGYDLLRAELLLAFVPLGLARPVIARLRVDAPIQLPETAVIPDAINNRSLPVRLADVPEFEVARLLGEETFQTGIIPRAQFGAAVGGSVELALINEALDKGVSISGAVVEPPHLLRLAEAPGFTEWYRSVSPRG